MLILESFVGGEWVRGSGSPQALVNPTTEEKVAETSTVGVDFARAVQFARVEGGAALRAMTFAERGEMLRTLSRAIHKNRDALIELAIANGGNTRSDAKFDIDGASGTLAFYAELGKELGAQKHLLDGDGIQLGRSPRFWGQHVFLPRRGVAVHINAFNFPAWGLAEKAACALLAGMPVISKPATSTALVSFQIMKLFNEANCLPRGALSFVAGSPGDLLSHLGGQDVIAFTGSSDTGSAIRLMPNLQKASVRINVEADSLNAAVLGPDVSQGSETYRLFLNDVYRDMTQKAGQKCTAIRRVFVPQDQFENVRDELAERLRDTGVGDPSLDGIVVGPVATAQQKRDVTAGIELLAKEAAIVVGSGPFEPKGVPTGKGYFVPPTLLAAQSADQLARVHDHEVFGPCSTLISTSGKAADVAAQVAKGGGGLVSSVYTDDRDFAADMIFEIGPWHGRLVMGSEKIADQTPGPGTVLPHTIHGGPGRAGGGEELGGSRGLLFYSQRTAVQGSRPILEAILGKKETKG
ncbi:MAG: 3,4-dehydroadipyl-CoA semialdehyde dehydrogenase [Polyangiaceae bacterium]|nr:3,4-dehydroadipyl-CoA semialdehyde dehydrogenase [Polyangiaceae bacterium]